MKTALFLTMFFFAGIAQAQQEQLRPELTAAGDLFLNEGASPEEFLRRAREQRERKPFTEEERLYLADVTKKLPAALRDSVCPTWRDGLCEADGPSLTESSLDDVTRRKLPEPAPLPEVPADEKSWTSRPIVWIAAIGLTLLAGSAALKGKELQIRPR